MTDLLAYLRNNPYPGRGLVVGQGQVIYFLMGRSENSRNRVMERTADGVRTRAFDESRVTDPSLIIYHPVRKCGSALVVTNGDQTDTIVEMGNFRQALATREYEPDAPNYTPRISAIVYDDASFELGILKRVQGRCVREFFAYPGCDPDKGFFLSTYAGPGDPLPSFQGEPMEIAMPTPEDVWQALHPDNRVALCACDSTGIRLWNKLLGD